MLAQAVGLAVIRQTPNFMEEGVRDAKSEPPYPAESAGRSRAAQSDNLRKARGPLRSRKPARQVRWICPATIALSPCDHVVWIWRSRASIRGIRFASPISPVCHAAGARGHDDRVLDRGISPPRPAVGRAPRIGYIAPVCRPGRIISNLLPGMPSECCRGRLEPAASSRIRGVRLSTAAVDQDDEGVWRTPASLRNHAVHDFDIESP